MKTIQLIILFTIISITPVMAQRAFPGMMGVRMTGGFMDGVHLKTNKLSYHTGVSFDRYTKYGNRWVYGVDYMQKNYSYLCGWIPVNTFSVEAGYLHQLFSDRSKTFFCSLGANGRMGYQSVNWGDQVLPDGATIREKEGFTYGVGLNLESETYLTNRIIFLAHVQERFMFGASVSNFHFVFGVGVKYIFN